MTSPVNWALLGLVIDRSSYGLELANRFQREYGNVLPISSESHVYAALNALEARAMVEEVPGSALGRQPRPRYRATAVGVRGYQEWLVGQMAEERRRQELWVRQLAIFVDDPETALQIIERFELEHMKGAGQAGSVQSDAVVDSRSELMDRLVAEQHRIALGGMLSWLQYARRTFEALASKPNHEPPRT